MTGRTASRVSGALMVLLSLAALGTVLTGYIDTPRTPAADEGTQAHIFQLSIALLAPVGLLFLATADRTERSMRPLAVAALAVVLAFALLYRLEHP